jgi:DNA-binding FadR family transcriptional regulator
VISIEHKNAHGARSITAELRTAIETGRYLDGDQLPPERDLSDTYSASRNTIRKALNNLEEAGLVVRKVGSGTFVNYGGPAELETENVVEQISPLQLIDARIGFERQMTRLAVVHATGRDIEKMESLLIQLEASEHDRDSFTKLDSEFHFWLAKASGNPLIVKLYHQINEVRTHSQWRKARELVLSPEKIRQYNIYHRGILDGLRNRDVKSAIEALNKHMELAHRDLVGTEAVY